MQSFKGVRNYSFWFLIIIILPTRDNNNNNLILNYSCLVWLFLALQLKDYENKVFSSFEVQIIFLNSFQSIHIIETNLLSECAEARNKHAM